MTIALLTLLGLLAFANGANDNSKGVATLVGSGAATPRRALLWAAVTTMLGAAVSCWFSGALVDRFSKGLFVQGAPLDSAFFVAVLIGAFSWVIIAVVTGLPVSTTHAIVGALIGAGLATFTADSIHWTVVVSKFVQPLALSPLVSCVIVYIIAGVVIHLEKRIATRCLCTTEVATEGASAAAVPAARFALVVDEEAACARQNAVVSVSTRGAGDVIHWLSCGFVGFARGWNDAPKIAALGVVALTSTLKSGGVMIAFLVVTLAMAAGGILSGGRVLQTLATKITPMGFSESLAASFTTAILVSLASWNGLPVSTTHVSTGAILGAGVKKNPRAIHWKKVGEVGLSWIVTLPSAALIAVIARLLLARLG